MRTGKRKGWQGRLRAPGCRLVPYRGLLTGTIAVTLLGTWAGPASAAGPTPVLASAKTLYAVVVVLVVVILAGILVYMIQNRDDIDDEEDRSAISFDGDAPSDFGTAGMYGSPPASEGFGAGVHQGFDPGAAPGGSSQPGFGSAGTPGARPGQDFGAGAHQGYGSSQPSFGVGAGVSGRPGFGGGPGAHSYSQPPGTLDDMLSSVVGSSQQPVTAAQRVASSAPLAPSGAVRPAGMPGTTSAAPNSRPALGVGSAGPTVRSPGWYPAAGDPYRQAYWDGSRWTTTIRWNGTAWEQTGAG